jgi:hypothetical protein
MRAEPALGNPCTAGRMLKAMMTRKLSVLAGGLLLAGLLAGCGSSAGTLATINGEPVTMEDFHNYLETKSNVRVMVGGQAVEVPVADTLAFQAMQDLVAQRLLLQIAKDQGVAPSPDDVDKEIKFKQTLQPAFIQTLTQRGLTTKQIRQLVEVQMAQERVVTKGVSLPDSEVQAEIKKRPNLFVEPPKATLELLFVSDAGRRDQADRAIRNGTGFTAVRQQYDQAPVGLRAQFDGTRMSGDGIVMAELNEPFRSAVASTTPGKLTNWMRAGDKGWARILVHRKTPKKDLEKTPERLAFLKRQLTMLKASRQIADAIKKGSDKSMPKMIGDKLKASQIKIVEPSLQGPWQRFEERLKAQAGQTKLPDAR